MLETNKTELRSSIPTCSIMGVNVAVTDMDFLVEFTTRNLHRLRGKYCCVSNVYSVVTAFRDKDYRKVQNNAVLVMPDGGPLSAVQRRRGYHLATRTTGPSFMIEMLSDPQISHFFYGSTPETLDKMVEHARSRFPKINISGVYSPPFRKLSEQEDADITKLINSAQPDVVWVGLGAPKQEKWMAEHEGQISAYMVGVGAAFDYLAGNIRRAPKWMQRTNLEWLYRLLQDPKRLFPKYFKTNFAFILHAVLLNQ